MSKIINDIISKALNEIIDKDKDKQQPPFKGEKPSGELSYESDIQFEGKSFKLKVGTNVNPSKKGIKIQFTPVGDGVGGEESAKQIDYTLSLQRKLNDALRNKDFEVDIDPDVPNKNTIAFLIRLDWFDKIIRNIFKNDAPQQEENPNN